MIEMDRRQVSSGVIVTIAAIASVLAAGRLPDRVVTHWSAVGTADGWMAAPALLVGGPALVLAVAVLFELLPRIDPLGANVERFQFAYDAAAVAIGAFLAYVHGLVIVWNLGIEVPIGQALAPAIGALAIVLGFVIDRAEQNWFVGIRTPWTLSSTVVWRETHDLGGTLFKIAGVIAFGGVIVPEYAAAIATIPLVAAALIAAGYSFVAYRRLDDSNRA